VLGGKVEPVLSELAVHYRLAGTAAEAEKAISYSERAGESALSLLAYEEAAEHWQAALAQMRERVSEPARLAHLLECLGSLNYLAALDCEAGIDHLQQSLATPCMPEPGPGDSRLERERFPVEPAQRDERPRDEEEAEAKSEMGAYDTRRLSRHRRGRRQPHFEPGHTIKDRRVGHRGGVTVPGGLRHPER